MVKYIKLWAFVLLVLISVTAFGVRAQDEEAIKGRVIQIAADSEMFSDWLAGHPNYHADAWGPDENGVWYVEFKNDGDEEWLGYANVNADTGEILDSFAPKPLPADVYQSQMPRVTAFVKADVEVLARLENNLDLWEVYTDWNRWDATWDVGFYRGIEGVVVKLNFDENDNLYIEKIIDPNALSEDEVSDQMRDDAINLAYAADGVWQAIEGHDDWATYVEIQGESIFSVSFATDDTTLVTVIVNVTDGEVLDVRVP